MGIKTWINKNRVDVLLALLFVVLYAVLHCICGLFGDDVYILRSVSQRGLWRVYVNNVHPGGWSSRFLVDFIWFALLSIPGYLWIWRCLSVAVTSLAMCSLSTVTGITTKKRGSVLAAFLFLQFPFWTMSTAGWMATTITYWWTACFAIVCLCVLHYVTYRKEKSHLWLYLIGILSGLYAADDELCSVFLTVACGAVCVATLLQKKPKRYAFILEGGIVFRLLFHLYWQSLGNRADNEIINWFPDFSMRTLADKLQVGFSSACYVIFRETCIPLLFLCIALAVLVFAKHKDMFHRVIVLVPLATVSIQGVLASHFAYLYRIDNSYHPLYGMIQNSNCYEAAPYIMLLIWGFSLICLLISVVSAFSDKDACGLCGVLLGGILSRMAMGFSPTVEASGIRTYVYLFMSIILCAFAVISQLNKENIKGWRTVYGIMLIVSARSYLNDLFFALRFG